MRLRAPVLYLHGTRPPLPDLRAAPGYSCGFALRSSISTARDRRSRTSALRLATHAASRSGPLSPRHATAAPGPPRCAWLLMRLRAPVLYLHGTRPPLPDLRAAPGYSCGFALRSSISTARDRRSRTSALRLATHAASRSGPLSPRHATAAPG